MLKIASLVILFLGTITAASAQKFGYVSSAAILAELPDVKSADAELEALQKQLQKKGQGMIEQLQKDYIAVQEKVERGELSPKQQEEESKKLQDRQTEIQKFEQDMVKQLQDKRNEKMQPIVDKINKAIQDVAKENGLQFIFEKDILLYADPAQDVSTMVRAKLGLQ